MQLHTRQAITILVNGETAERGFAEAAVATALNGEFVPRAARAETRLAANDTIEIVAPRQGG